MKKRKYSHYASARNGSNLYFHNAIRKYGESNIQWKIIEEIECGDREKLIDLLNEREIFYINLDNTNNPHNGYNLTIGGGNYNEGNIGIRKGKTFEEIFGEEKAQEIRKKQSEGRRGKAIGRIQSKEEIEKRALSNTGKKRKPITGEKIRQANLGKKRNDEQRKNMSLSQLGKPHAQNFGPLRFGKNNSAYKIISQEEEKIILDLYLNKGYGSRKIEKYFNNKFSFIKILKFLRGKGIYKEHKFDGNKNKKISV